MSPEDRPEDRIAALVAPRLAARRPGDPPLVLGLCGAQGSGKSEEALRQSRGSGEGVMNDAQLARFVSHYERLTRHIWHTMPERADLCLRLAADRSLRG